LRRFTHLDNGRSSGSTPSTAPRCGYTQQYLTDRLKEAQTTALAQFGDFFFKTTEEAPTTEFKRLVGDKPLVRCLECDETVGRHKHS